MVVSMEIISTSDAFLLVANIFQKNYKRMSHGFPTSERDHRKKFQVEFMGEITINSIGKPSYSSDLAPCDFFLVPEQKLQLVGSLTKKFILKVF